MRIRQHVAILIAAVGLTGAGGWTLPGPTYAPRAVLPVALPPLGDFGMQTRDALPPSQTVRRIQELLQGLGAYHGEVHGRLDDETTEAIRAYQRRAGLEDNGRPTEELITHIEFTSKAIELGQRLDTVRTEQMRAAEQALLAQPETRRLIAGRPAEETADITRDASACFAAPTQACLLKEASDSAKGIFDVRFRDWALGEIVTGLARNGLADEAFDTAGRITDPRLIVVALRDISVARAELGQIDQAIAVASVIPEAPARVKALVAIAVAQSRAGVSPNRTLTEIEQLARAQPADRAGSLLLTEASSALARIGRADATVPLLAVAQELAERSPDRDNELAVVAAAIAATGRGDVARALTATLPDSGRRPVYTALATMEAGTGDVAAARAEADSISEPRYRVATLIDVALTVGGRDGPAPARGLLLNAAEEARKLEERPTFARSNSLRAVAVGLAQFGWSADARATAAEVSDVRLRAEALWAVAASFAGNQDLVAAEQIRQQALADTASISSALDRTWVLCGAATAASRAGDTVGMRSAFARALEEARGIADAWARSQAMTRVSTALGVMH